MSGISTERKGGAGKGGRSTGRGGEGGGEQEGASQEKKITFFSCFKTLRGFGRSGELSEASESFYEVLGSFSGPAVGSEGVGEKRRG